MVEKSLAQILGFTNNLELSVMSRPEIRDLISKIEDLAKEKGVPTEIPIHHHFSKGVYAREMRMKEGNLVVGKIHRHENLNILSSGTVSVLSQDGVQTISAPHTFVAGEGAKRVIYAHTDCVWTVIHGTEEKDLEKIEAEFIAKDYEEIKFKEAVCLGSQ